VQLKFYQYLEENRLDTENLIDLTEEDFTDDSIWEKLIIH
jgi:hypothetical protein